MASDLTLGRCQVFRSIARCITRVLMVLQPPECRTTIFPTYQPSSLEGINIKHSNSLHLPKSSSKYINSKSSQPRLPAQVAKSFPRSLPAKPVTEITKVSMLYFAYGSTSIGSVQLSLNAHFFLCSSIKYEKLP